MRRLPTTPTLATATSWSGPRRFCPWVARVPRRLSTWPVRSTRSSPSDVSHAEIGWMSATRSRWNCDRLEMKSEMEEKRAEAATTTSPKATSATDP